MAAATAAAIAAVAIAAASSAYQVHESKVQQHEQEDAMSEQQGAQAEAQKQAKEQDQQAKDEANKNIARDQAEARQRALTSQYQGVGSTILTSPLGTAGPAQTAGKTLLGT